MQKTIIIFGLFILLASVCFAQQEDSKDKANVIFKADTEFSAQIENQIDTAKARIGEDINFIITEDIKGEKETIKKGSELYARIVNVQKASAKNENVSKVSIMFDFVKKDDNFVPLTASIVAVGEMADLTFDQSPTYDGGTIISMKGKNLRVDKGKVFRVKLIKDVVQ